MKRVLFFLIVSILLPSYSRSEHLSNQKELIINAPSTNYSIALAKYLADQGVVKYSAYWCPNCLSQAQLFGKQAYKELIVVECAQDGKYSQTELCIKKNIEGFPSWEINGKIILGIQTLKDLAELTGFQNYKE